MFEQRKMRDKGCKVRKTKKKREGFSIRVVCARNQSGWSGFHRVEF